MKLSLFGRIIETIRTTSCSFPKYSEVEPELDSELETWRAWFNLSPPPLTRAYNPMPLVTELISPGISGAEFGTDLDYTAFGALSSPLTGLKAKSVFLRPLFTELCRQQWERQNHPKRTLDNRLVNYWLENLYIAATETEDPESVNNMLRMALNGMSKISDDDAILLRLHQLMRKILDRKRLFKTAGGLYGVASRAIRDGDQIAMFNGCTILMVIRPSENGWRLVCPAFVETLSKDLFKIWAEHKNDIQSFSFE